MSFYAWCHCNFYRLFDAGTKFDALLADVAWSFCSHYCNKRFSVVTKYGANVFASKFASFVPEKLFGPAINIENDAVLVHRYRAHGKCFH